MRPTPTIFFLSILLTIESLVGAVAIHNREVYKRAPGAEYKIDAYQDFNCAGHILGTIKGTGSMSMVRAVGANCVRVVKELPAACTLILHMNEGNKNYPGYIAVRTEYVESFYDMSVKCQ